MQGNFTKDKNKFSLLLKEICFHCLNHMCLVKMNGKKEIFLIMKVFMSKTFELSFLEKNNRTELSEKENKLLYRYFKYKNINELMVAFNNTKTADTLDELFDKIVNKLTLLKKLIDTVSDITEKERINNVINSIEFVLDYVVFHKNVSYSYSDSDSKQDFSDPRFSDTKGSRLKIFMTNQMLSRLPITLAQLKAGNNSEKLKNEIRQLLYSLYRSKKLTKNVYNNLINAI